MKFLFLSVLFLISCQSHQYAQSLESTELINFVAESINSRDLASLDPYFSPNAKIYEQGSIDDSWPYYRDGHLGQEIEEFEEFELNFDIQESFERSDMAFVRGFYNLQATMEGEPITSRGLITFTMTRQDSTWQIIHLQFSRSCR